MMIGLTLNDCTSTIKLLKEDGAYHLMREGESRKRQLLVGTGIDSRRKTIGATDNKDKTTRDGLLFLKPLRQLNATRLTSMFIEQHNSIRRLQQSKYLLTLSSLLLFLCETLRIFQLRNNGNRERHVMSHAFTIVGYEFLKLFTDRLAY